MLITLAFPTLAAPTALVSLPDVEHLPRSRPVRRFQTAFRTDAGADVIYDFGGKSEVFTMKLSPLSKVHADAVRAFFDNASPNGVDGRASTFQVQDSDGIIYTVRFAQDVMEPQQIGVSWNEVSLTLKVV